MHHTLSIVSMRYYNQDGVTGHYLCMVWTHRKGSRSLALDQQCTRHAFIFLVDFLPLALPFLNRKTPRITSCTQSCTLNREIHMLLRHLVGKHLRRVVRFSLQRIVHCCCQQNKTVSYIYAVCLFFKKFAVLKHGFRGCVCVSELENYRESTASLNVPVWE